MNNGWNESILNRHKGKKCDETVEAYKLRKQAEVDSKMIEANRIFNSLPYYMTYKKKDEEENE